MEDPEEYKRLAVGQRQWARDLADALDRDHGGYIDKLDAPIVAGILRLWANQVKDVRPLRRGEKRSTKLKIDPMLATTLYAHKRAAGIHKTEALESVAHYLS